jgi:uncharacterized protein (TIGR01777 family)
MKVLITGATGLVGKELILLLTSKNIEVNYLTTRETALNSIPNCKGFYWNLKNNEIDVKCINGVDKIIHLAGASVAKRWTDSYKKEIISSRVLSTQLLFSLLKTNQHQITQIVSASAIGIYKNSFETIYDEDSVEFGTGFLTEVVKQWEREVDLFSELNVNISKIRIGLVLSENGGALSELVKPIKMGFGSPIATGKQIVSWIHISDLSRLFLHVIETNSYGVYNASAPIAITNKELTTVIAKQLDKPLFLPNIPKFVMKLILGEMHEMVCGSQKVSSKKIQSTGFYFKYDTIESALRSLLA